MPVTIRSLFLGQLLMLFGGGVFAADSTPVAVLEAAAQQGDGMAQAHLAARYELADGVVRDFLKANYLYCQSAKGGNREAQFKLGWIYANGKAVPKNPDIEAGLLSLAAAQGHEHAKPLLQYMVENMHVKPDMQIPGCVQPEPSPMLRLSRTLSDIGVGNAARQSQR